MTSTRRPAHLYQWVLVAWTVAIWGSRIRNIFVDDELTGADRIVSISVAVGLLGAAILFGSALITSAKWSTAALVVLVAVGVVRWTIRGPLILASDEWDAGFKIVHTVLWLVTVALSLLAWREHRRAEAR